MAGLLPMKAAKLQATPPIQCAQHGRLISSRPVESASNAFFDDLAVGHGAAAKRPLVKYR